LNLETLRFWPIMPKNLCGHRLWTWIFNPWFLLRATSHMSQEPWSCNGEDPWLSSKGHTMCVGKAVICGHGPSSIVWSENGPCCGTIAYFVGGKRGRIWFNIMCLKLYQFKRIIWWCLSVLESFMEVALQYVSKSIMLEKILKKSWSPGIFVRPTSFPVDHTPLSIVRHVGLHIDFSFTNFFGPLDLHPLVWSELGRSLPQPCVWSGPQWERGVIRGHSLAMLNQRSREIDNRYGLKISFDQVKNVLLRHTVNDVPPSQLMGASWKGTPSPHVFLWLSKNGTLMSPW
jgi:hypothetical protein